MAHRAPHCAQAHSPPSAHRRSGRLSTNQRLEDGGTGAHSGRQHTHTNTCTNAVTGYLRSSWTSRKGITRSSACFPLRMSNHGGMDHTRAAVGGGCPAALYYDRKVRVGQKKFKKKRFSSVYSAFYSSDCRLQNM